MRAIGSRTILMAGSAALATVLAVLLVAMGLSGCRTPPPSPEASQARLDKLQSEPVMRVRIRRDLPRVTFDCAPAPGSQASSGTLRIQSNTGQSISVQAPLTIEATADAQRVILRQPRDQFVMTAATLVITAVGEQIIRVDDRQYPGTMVVHLPAVAGGFEIINHVAMEDYLPGVLDGELYASWHPVTFQAQAIAARSYAIAEMARTRRRHYDLEATQASQVYKGLSTRGKAIQGARTTRGMVLVYNNAVVPAYYSSCSGGVGQDAAFAFPNGLNIPPLRGRVQGTWGSSSRYFRWGPIQRDRTTLARRIAAWGQANRHAVAQLTGLASVTASKYNQAGRPAEFTLTDDAGREFRLGPESFRFACNFQAPTLPSLADAQLLRSSHATVAVSNRWVIISGQGFGHGVGMDQHGAESMAQHNYNAAAILGFYYPQSQLIRAY